MMALGSMMTCLPIVQDTNCFLSSTYSFPSSLVDVEAEEEDEEEEEEEEEEEGVEGAD